jgi:hypothetical protein
MVRSLRCYVYSRFPMVRSRFAWFDRRRSLVRQLLQFVLHLECAERRDRSDIYVVQPTHTALFDHAAGASLSLKERAITSIAELLRKRPELIIAVMQLLEQQT